MAVPVYLFGALSPTIIGSATRISDGTIEITFNPYLPKDLKKAISSNQCAYSISYINTKLVKVIAYGPWPVVAEKET